MNPLGWLLAWYLRKLFRFSDLELELELDPMEAHPWADGPD